MTTAKEIFNIAICLMDAQNESTGSTETADTREYQVRTPSLLNSILDRACPASDNWRTAEEGRRPVCPKVTDLTDPIDLDERICTGVLPYGLAGLLLSEENPTLANFFWQTFLEQLEEARRGVPSGAEAIEDCYGFMGDNLEFGQFSRW